MIRIHGVEGPGVYNDEVILLQMVGYIVDGVGSPSLVDIDQFAEILMEMIVEEPVRVAVGVDDFGNNRRCIVLKKCS